MLRAWCATHDEITEQMELLRARASAETDRRMSPDSARRGEKSTARPRSSLVTLENTR
jgi:hypothetical protein